MMKHTTWVLMAMLAATAAAASQRNVSEDRTAPEALITWSDPVKWQTGLMYAHLSRGVELPGGTERALSGDIFDAAVGVSPWPWLLLYGQAGASQAQLEDVMSTDADLGAGGLLGARLSLWQIYEGIQSTAWRFTLQLAGQYAYRTTEDDGEGDLQWSETLVMLPLDYHLTFARSFRNIYMVEFHSLRVYAGPAYSKLDGTWTRDDSETDFEQVRDFGVVGGVDLWLLESLSFGARIDWFEDTTLRAYVRYYFF